MTPLSIHDLLIAPFWLLATGKLLQACWCLGARMESRVDPLTQILDCLVLGWAMIVLVALALSHASCLYPCLLIALVAGGAAIMQRLIIARRVRHACFNLTQEPTRRFGADYLFVGAFSASLFDPMAIRRDLPWRMAWMLCACVAFAAIVDWGLLHFTVDWDSLAYHAPAVDQWLRAKSINSTHSSSWFHPGNNELLALWCVGAFSGDFLINLTNSVSVVLLALGTRELSRRLGARPAASHLAGFAAITPYVVTRQLFDGENDIAVAALFVTSLGYGICCARRARAGRLLLWSASVGLLPGVKYYALGYAAIAGIGVSLVALRWRGVRAAASVGFAGLAGMILLSGAWYLRNYAITGSPLYPRGFFDERDLLSGMFPHLRQTTLFGNGDWQLTRVLLLRAIWNRLGGAHLLASLTIPMTGTWLAAIGMSGWSRPRRSGHTMLAFSIFGGIAVFGSTPFVVEILPGTLDMLEEGYLPARFFLPTATAAIVALCLCMDRLSAVSVPQASAATGWLFRKVPLGLLAVAALSQLLLAKPEITDPDPLSLLLAGTCLFLLLALCAYVYNEQRTPFKRNLCLLLALAGCSLAISALGGCWHARFARFYDAFYETRLFSSLESLAPRGLRICALTYRGYPFLGSRRQFEVFGPVYAGTHAALADYLRQTQPDLVVTINGEVAGAHRYHRMDAWMAELETPYQEAYSDDRFTAYRRDSPRLDVDLSSPLHAQR